MIAANEDNGLNRDSVALIEQVQTIPVSKLIGRIGSLRRADIANIGKAWDIQFPFHVA